MLPVIVTCPRPLLVKPFSIAFPAEMPPPVTMPAPASLITSCVKPLASPEKAPKQLLPEALGGRCLISQRRNWLHHREGRPHRIMVIERGMIRSGYLM